MSNDFHRRTVRHGIALLVEMSVFVFPSTRGLSTEWGAGLARWASTAPEQFAPMAAYLPHLIAALAIIGIYAGAYALSGTLPVLRNADD